MNYCGVGTPTNGRGGWATEGTGLWGNGNGNMNFINSANAGVTIDDLNSASNSSMDPSGATPVYGAPGLPAVSEDLCNRIKCGATDADLPTKLACSNAYGAGVWALCTDPRCAPYKGSSCLFSPIPSVTAQEQTAPGLTQQNLTPSFPVITGTPSPLMVPEPASALCGFNSWVASNPCVASLAALGVFMLISGFGGKR